MSKFIYDFGDPVYIEPFHSVYLFFPFIPNSIALPAPGEFGWFHHRSR